MDDAKILIGDSLTVLKGIPSDTIDCCVTSPPYYQLRSYDVDGQIGLEDTPEEYIERLTEVFREVKRCMKPTGTLWLNIGDSYAGSGKGRNGDGTASIDEDSKQYTNKGSIMGVLPKGTVGNGLKPKDMIGIPWMLAFSLRTDGWYLRNDIIWEKVNALPSPVKDRCTSSYEHVFLMAKERYYYFSSESIAEPIQDTTRARYHRGRTDKHKYIKFNGEQPINSMEYLTKNHGETRNKRDVWHIANSSYHGAHFATYPEKLVEPCILAGCPYGGTVLDPFCGSGTTGVVALKHGRKFIGIELNPEYARLAEERINGTQLKL